MVRLMSFYQPLFNIPNLKCIFLLQRVFTNSVDPEETALEPSRQDLHYLPFFLAETPIWNNRSDHIQVWKRPIKKLGDDSVDVL